MQTNRRPFHVKRTGQLPVLRLFSARSSVWSAVTFSSHCITPSGHRRRTRSALTCSAQAEHDRRRSTGQARNGRRVVVGDVDPLPFDEHAGPEAVGVGPHQVGLICQRPPSSSASQCWPLPRFRPMRGASPSRTRRRSGKGSPTRSASASPLDRRLGSGPSRQRASGLSRFPSLRPGSETARGSASAGGSAEQVGPAVEVEVDGLGRPPAGR